MILKKGTIAFTDAETVNEIAQIGVDPVRVIVENLGPNDVNGEWNVRRPGSVAVPDSGHALLVQGIPQGSVKTVAFPLPTPTGTSDLGPVLGMLVYKGQCNPGETATYRYTLIGQGGKN